jgi:predicted Zn-dependent protease
MSIWRYGLIGVALVACAQQKPVNFYSVDKEIELGARLASEMASNITPLNNPAASAYVDRVVRELAAQIPDSPFPYAVTVLKDDVRPEPVVLPGGSIYVSTAMFRAAQSESEFSGLLARAVADVEQRVATRLLTREDIKGIAMRQLESMGGWQGDAVRQGMGLSMPQGMQVFRRQLDLASDAMAVRMMASAGYDPSGLAQYVSRTGKNDGVAGWDEFQQRRLTALRQAAAAVTVAPGGYGAEFARVRNMLAQ